MNQHDQATCRQPHSRCGVRLKNLVDDIHLDEVIACTQRANLLTPALPGTIADLAGIGAVQPPALLGVNEVGLGCKAPLLGPVGALTQNGVQFVDRGMDDPFAAYAAWAVAVQQGCQRIEIRLCRRRLDLRGEQPNTAVDVVADSTRRDHAVWMGCRRHATDRKAIALVHIGHDHHWADQAGQRCGVDSLLQRFVGSDLLEKPAAGEDAHGAAHIGSVGLGNLPFIVANLAKVAQFHRSPPQPADSGLS